MEVAFVYSMAKRVWQICSGQLGSNQQTTVRTRVGSTYRAGEDGGIISGIYSGEAGALIGWKGDPMDICGENGGLECG